MKPVILCILDGVGINEKEKGNAYKIANTPFLDELFSKYSHSKLEASGELVGLPPLQMGNSEVGHSNIGAGRIVYQPIERINNDLNKNFYDNKNILEIFDYVKKNNVKLHLMGLVSDGGVHSSMKHIEALIKMCENNNIKPYIHAFTDGRDTLPTSSYKFLSKLNENYIASISGRYYAMDRDNRYDRVEKAYNMLIGNGKTYNSAKDAIDINYNNNVTDEFIEPGLIKKDGVIESNDAIIYFNFRPDRIRELASAFTNVEFNGFERTFLNIKLLTLMPVSDEVICTNAYGYLNIENTLGEVIANNGLKQLRIAETEKYAHVTYFLDGGKELKLKNCDRVLMPSPKVATYDLKPEMSAYEITEKLLSIMHNYDFIILNFANGDMVGHTGDLNAAIKGVETLDECVAKIYNNLDGTLIITADHGNCEEMIDDDGNILTSHTTNKVPFLITKDVKVRDGKLADIAPTILKLLNIKIPPEMEGISLID